MYLNNKGLILITTLMIFSIISTVCMMCIGLNYSNKSIFNLEHKNIHLKELALGAIEIVHSNISKEVEIAVQRSKNEEEFKQYFLENNFIHNIKDISKSDLDNVLVNTSKKILYDKEGFIYFDIICNSSEDTYTKKIQASVKILNPYLAIKENEKDEENIIDKPEVDDSNLNDIKDYYEENKHDSIDSKSLVIIYNYKEI
ncbi:hypothetical protein [Faecalimicrobium sp. JNUCC 81]